MQVDRAWASKSAGARKVLCAVPHHAATPASLTEQAQREVEALAEKLGVDHLPSLEQQVPSWER